MIYTLVITILILLRFNYVDFIYLIFPVKLFLTIVIIRLIPVLIFPHFSFIYFQPNLPIFPPSFHFQTAIPSQIFSASTFLNPHPLTIILIILYYFTIILFPPIIPIRFTIKLKISTTIINIHPIITTKIAHSIVYTVQIIAKFVHATIRVIRILYSLIFTIAINW